MELRLDNLEILRNSLGDSNRTIGVRSIAFDKKISENLSLLQFFFQNESVSIALLPTEENSYNFGKRL